MYDEHTGSFDLGLGVHEVDLLRQVFVQVTLVEQEVVLLVGAVDAVRTLEAGLLPALVFDVSLQGALVLVFVTAVDALVQSPPDLGGDAQSGRAVPHYRIRIVQVRN